MALNTVGKQWAYIVSDLEVLVAFQQRKVRLEHGANAEVTVFNLTVLSILEYALAQAKEQYRKVRFAFWKSAVIATSQLELMHLLEIKQKLKTAQAADGVSRNGEIYALDIGIERLMKKLAVTDPSGNRTLIPGYHD